MVVYCGVWTCMEGEGGTIASGALRRVRLGVMLRKSFFRSRAEFSRDPPYTHTHNINVDAHVRQIVSE